MVNETPTDGFMTAHVSPTQNMSFRARSLLAFVLEPTPPVSEWIGALDGWLARSPSFFASKPVILELAGLEISLEEYRELLNGLARRQIRVMAVENPARALVGPDLPPVVTGGRAVNALTVAEEDATPAAVAPKPKERTNSLIVDANVRSGQSIVHEGDVTIVGRVASGAEIVAGGSVHIYGALQGRVIAGISGLPGARIFCREARAELLCIGGAYLTAENMNPKTEGRCLEARLDGEKLEIRILD
jgi:septum site-determining protein MinC